MDKNGKMKKAGGIHLVTLSSPIGGTVVARHSLKGEFVEAYRELFSIVDLSSVWVEVLAPVSLAAHIRIGQSVKVFSREVQNPQRAVVIFVSPLADPQTRMVPVRLLLANPQGIWRPGACVTAEFIQMQKSVPVRLPRAALQEIEGAFVVFIEESPGVFAPRRVVPGEEDDQFVEVPQVSPGERVVVLDDVITTGGSTITAIERVQEAGLIVDRVIALIDREEGGRENIVQLVDRVDAVLTRTEVMAFYRK
jgi:multidrug efflux pump subunit AcrA (membrane-fusion protein)